MKKQPATPIRRVLLGISGGIAAYKTPELVRLLRAHDLEVRVVMTQGAKAFVTALTLQALSGQAVHDTLWDPAQEAAMSHIALARWAEVILIAPATAHCLAKLAQGLADDLLSTLCLAGSAPIWIAPAMNRLMWEHPATQANVLCLQGRGVRFIGPEEGIQACGEWGEGRMSEPGEVIAALLNAGSEKGLLLGKKVMITLGPTREPLDPVRFISNRSSGRMGLALAQEALRLGATVWVVAGPMTLPLPQGIQVTSVETAEEMQAAVLKNCAEMDIFIAAAAVTDYRPAQIAAEKLKKSPLSGSSSTLALTLNPDILARVAQLPVKPFCVGFSAETAELPLALQWAEEKRCRKKCDMMVLNRVSDPGVGFEFETNEVTVLWEGGSRRIPMAAKSKVSETLWQIIHEKSTS